MEQETTDWKKVARRIKRIYGPDVNRHTGSPHEKEGLLDDAELCLHEICHLAFIDRPSFKLGEFDQHFDLIGDSIDNMNDGIADLHEVRTIATELLVAETLGIPLRPTSVTRSGYQNTQMGKHRYAYAAKQSKKRPSLELFESLVERASHTVAVQRATQDVLYLITDLGCHRGLKNKRW